MCACIYIYYMHVCSTNFLVDFQIAWCVGCSSSTRLRLWCVLLCMCAALFSLVDFQVAWCLLFGRWVPLRRWCLLSEILSHGALPLEETCRDLYFIAAQPAPALHLAHPEGCAALRIVLVTVPRVSLSLPPPETCR